MENADKSTRKLQLIPLIVDVERNIDNYQMIRCSYYSIQSDEPISNRKINIGGIRSPILILNLEAILVGPPENQYGFRKHNDISAMYKFVERHDELFVDINDIWVPKDWFGNMKVKQGMVFRISQERFSLCWKLRNDKITVEELFEDENVSIKEVRQKLIRSPVIHFSEEETIVFNDWTKRQIEKSRKRYNKYKNRALKKIK